MAHVIAVKYYLAWRELETVVAISESGISLAKSLEGSIGRPLDKYVFVLVVFIFVA
jgi:hypothetical protein